MDTGGAMPLFQRRKASVQVKPFLGFEMKTCRKCGSAFDTKYCKPCDRARSAAYRAKNPERVKASIAAWNESHKERKRELARDWYEKNAEVTKQRASEWRDANPDKAKIHRSATYFKNKAKIQVVTAIYHQKNKSEINARKSVWKASNPDAVRRANHSRRFRKVSAVGVLSKGIYQTLFAKQRGLCACCGAKLGSNYHLDHIMPLVLGGTNEDSNVQLLHSRCNLQKHAKHPVDFMQQKGFLL